ncbi:hypothetical protein RhiirC2_762489 [Rhizophagus irregularis]|uniref:Transmembrane protein n=1 Tax=Rhizophagus irregularis TaxID=588596 RepID=A0A2N1MDG0_9GLOM|nr:hypothetical protein RhiirC2_762489 [Rhizophagus irregularis]
MVCTWMILLVLLLLVAVSGGSGSTARAMVASGGEFRINFLLQILNFRAKFF